MANTISW